MRYTKKKLIIVGAAIALLVTPVAALATSGGPQDDWKTRICMSTAKYNNGRCFSELDIYVKEWTPRPGVTCWIANGEGTRYASGASISCIKDE